MKTAFCWAAAMAGYLGWVANALADSEQTLGSLLFTDLNLSINRNQACATCHSLVAATNAITGLPFAAPGFVDPLNVLNGTPVSAGSVAGDFGSLNAPSVGYAAFTPDFFWDGIAEAFTGGFFWNGRATNLQAQAAAPFLNPMEMAMPSQWAVVTRLKENTNYVALFRQIYDLDLDSVPAGDLAPATNDPPAAVPAVYAAATQAIAEFERSPAFGQFTSKFDFWLAGMTSLSSNELAGLTLFNGKANCANCHFSDNGIDAAGNPMPPLFSSFIYANVGRPRNWKIPGAPAPDPGLGGRSDIAAVTPDGSQLGMHKIMSLRNVALTPPYGHNGVLASLPQLVHFYNTRDTLGLVDANTNANFGVTGWPPPEMPTNVNIALTGNLRLSAEEEAQLVAFLETLTDDYPATAADPAVPPGTPSPFGSVVPPSIPVNLTAVGLGRIRVSGRLGKSYQIQFANSLQDPIAWQSLATVRLQTNGLLVLDNQAASTGTRFYRAFQIP